MARDKPPPPDGDDIPMWFMTYSDVITLMMTFFILLLTFATSEPERFEQMKVTVFGASGAPGIAGNETDGVEKDSWLMRVRPRSSRLTQRGNEVPPVDKEAPQASLDEGLAGLEDRESRQIVSVINIVVPAQHFGSVDGELFEYGKRNMKMLADMLRRKAYDVTFEVSDEKQLPRASACVQSLFYEQAIALSRMGVSIAADDVLSSSDIRIVLRASKNTQSQYGQEKTQTAQ